MDLGGDLILRAEGLYCPAADLYIDPVRPVPRALITHGHSDHARAGHEAVLATAETLDIMAVRYGDAFAGRTQPLSYGERLDIGGIGISLHPAGHVLGSAQARLHFPRQVVVVSGDYKRELDPTCTPFEIVRCDVFITEATFGLPVFRHARTDVEVAKIMSSLAIFPERAHLVGAYALGKAQRVMALLRRAGYDRPIYIHGALERLTRYYESQGFDFGEIRKVQPQERDKLGGHVVICPPGALQDLWARRFVDPVIAFASGWMRVRARARQRGVDLPLVVSDHADWEALCTTAVETTCKTLLVTHGEADALVHWARQNGMEAEPLHLLGYGEEEGEEAAS